jgi:hypothetical protein
VGLSRFGLFYLINYPVHKTIQLPRERGVRILYKLKLQLGIFINSGKPRLGQGVLQPAGGLLKLYPGPKVVNQLILCLLY